MARWVSIAIFVLLLVALVSGPFFGPVGPVYVELVPTAVQIICAVFAVGWGLWTAIHRGSLTSTWAMIESSLQPRILSGALIAHYRYRSSRQTTRKEGTAQR